MNITGIILNLLQVHSGLPQCPRVHLPLSARYPGTGSRWSKKADSWSGFRRNFSAHPQPAPQCVGEAHWLPAGGGWAARRDPEGNVHAVHNAVFYEAVHKAGTECVHVYRYVFTRTDKY